MSQRERDRPHRELQILRKHQESSTMLAIIMAGIAALFIIGIIAAYNYASSTATVERAGPQPTTTAPATRSAPETTGSGNSERPKQAVPDKSQKQQ